jgi:hypothetical protein
MANNKQTLGGWKAAAKEAAVLEDDGDILMPLKRVRDQYIRRAVEIEEKAPGKGASDEEDKAKRARMLEVAAGYRVAADAVQLCIGVIRCQDLVEAPAPVDQTETVLCDRPDAVTRAAVYENMEASVIRQLEDMPPLGA